jgi:hypothetical protein
MKLVAKLTQVYDKVYAISDRLGVNQHVDFSYTDRVTQLSALVLPRPLATAPPTHKLYGWQQQNVEVNSGDRYITGVSRTFSGITKGAICTVDGKPHSILWIDTDQSVTYNLLVRPERSR